jgi:hypothetical protein
LFFRRRERFRTSDPYRVNAPDVNATSAVARSCNAGDVANVDRETACVSVSPDDSSRIVTGVNAEHSDWSDPPESPDASRSAQGLSAERSSTAPDALDSVRDLERAIIAATLAGRHSTAELLADRLRERLARDRANIVCLDDQRHRQR